MKKQSVHSTQTSQNEQLEVVIIKKSHGVCSQEIKMKLPPETTFGSIIKFMQEQDLLKTKNAIVRPSHNESHVIGHNRKIQECVNIIKLRFIIQEVDENKSQPGGKVQALRNDNYEGDSQQKSNVCGRDDCLIM